ncbi:MAG: DUF3237 domain-containing protein [Pigmentiphaga sp.]
MLEPKFEYAMSVRLTLGPKLALGQLPKGGDRYSVEILGGTFEGPRLKGKVLRGGGDWPHIRPDGVFDFDARYLLQEDDGTLIYLRNRGFRWGSDEVMARMARREPVDPSEYYMRTAPDFEVPQGPHDWLTRYVFVGVGDKTPEGNVIHYYQVL